MLDADLGQLFSLHKIGGQWSAMWGASGSGELWVSKVVYLAKINKKNELVFQFWT